MNAALEAVFVSIDAANPRVGWLDFAAVVVAFIITIAGFSFLARRDVPAKATFTFFAEEAAR